MQSVGQGNVLAADLGALGLNGNQARQRVVMAKKGQQKIPIEGAKVTVIGPLKSRLEALRKEWAKALKKPKKARQAALQALFLPETIARQVGPEPVVDRRACGDRQAQAAADGRRPWRRHSHGLEGARAR